MLSRMIEVNEATFFNILKAHHVPLEPEVDKTVQNQVIEDFWDSKHKEIKGCARHFSTGKTTYTLREELIPYDSVLHDGITGVPV